LINKKPVKILTSNYIKKITSKKQYKMPRKSTLEFLSVQPRSQ
jgi:hypothetical protein